MKKYSYLVLLYFLRSLIYIKRATVWALKASGEVLVYLEKLFQRTAGFWFYKIIFSLKKYFDWVKIPWDSHIVDWVGKRNTLQIVLFVVCVAIMIPHSKLYTRDTTQIAGRGTLLYSLVGPGYQDFAIEEIVANINTDIEQSGAGWREGSVSSLSPGSVGIEKLQEVREISAISAGGSAVTKPTILPGTSLPTVTGVEATGRTEMVYYDVQAGDIIGEIAERFGISASTILWANNLSERSYIRPGDSLKILPVDGILHSVKSGDTVSKIARIYDAEIDSVVKFNRLQKDGADIVIGENLIVPGGKKPQPIYSYTASAPASIRSVAAPPPSVSAPAGSGYLWPTSVRYISQYFGWRHAGLDIAGPVGTPIYASKAGKVIKSQCGYNGGYGCYIIVDHGGGVSTLYGHASQLYVSAGDYVSQGQTIMAMGSTGRSTGPHIHFEVRVGGVHRNPLQYIR